MTFTNLSFNNIFLFIGLGNKKLRLGLKKTKKKNNSRANPKKFDDVTGGFKVSTENLLKLIQVLIFFPP